MDAPTTPPVPTTASAPGDKMPKWVWKAIAAFWAGLVALWVLKGFVHALRGLFIVLLLSAFLSFAIEPAVNRLARRGWRRGTATWLVFLAIFLAGALFTGVMGSLVVSQVQKFVKEAPDYVADLEDWLNENLPGDAQVNFDEVINDLQDPQKGVQRFSDDLATKVLDFSSRAVGIIFQMFTPLMLGSWWAFIPSVIIALLYVLRTALEDRTLQAELDGYREYVQQVRYRLLPGVW